MRELPRRTLGSTGLEVSVLSFGASPLGSIYGEIDEEECIRAVHEAHRLGINYFDTSPYYGDTRSEKVLGRALKGLPRDQIILATKVGRYGANDFQYSAEKVTSSVHESLERLQVDYIDVIQCHDIEFVDLDQVVNETLPALMKLKSQGLVRHIGISGLPFKSLHTVLDRVEEGTVQTVLSYCHCCLNDMSLLDELPYFQSKDVAVINASVLSMGLLTTQGPPEWHPAPDALKAAAHAAVAAVTSQGCDIVKLAIKEAMRQDGIVTHLLGCTTVKQVQANVQAALEGLGLAEVDGTGEHEGDAYKAAAEALKPVMGITWTSGRPENN